MNRENTIDHQPGFCPVCGHELVLEELQKHLERTHRLRARDRAPLFRLAWREIQCALLGITEPEWNGP